MGASAASAITAKPQDRPRRIRRLIVTPLLRRNFNVAASLVAGGTPT
jgi:hypothetical protein